VFPGTSRRMNRRRYDGYVTFKGVIADEPLDGDAATVLHDLAEGLLLARDREEARAVRDRVPEALAALVERGDLSRSAAHRCWARLRPCGPTMDWPPSWERVPDAGWVVGGH
jgi:hypothetical protein